jgi:hypothetical protein
VDVIGRGARWLAALGLAAALAGCGSGRDTEAGSRGPAPPGGDGSRLHSTPGPATMTITVETLRTWSEQLCTLPPVDFAAAVAALGIAGSIVASSDDYATVDPPPAGATRLGLSRENLGKNKGNLGALEVTLAGGAPTRAELDRRFGAGNPLPRVDYDRDHVVSYQVEVAGAPFRCTVFASFGEEPAAASAVTKVSLRRDVVRAPAPASPR